MHDSVDVAADHLDTLRASVRRLESHIRQIEDSFELSSNEIEADPVGRSNWEKIKEAIPDKAVVEVLLEYLLQEVSGLPARQLEGHCQLADSQSATGFGLAGI